MLEETKRMELKWTGEEIKWKGKDKTRVKGKGEITVNGVA